MGKDGRQQTADQNEYGEPLVHLAPPRCFVLFLAVFQPDRIRCQKRYLASRIDAILLSAYHSRIIVALSEAIFLEKFRGEIGQYC
jgi:hypothetical protein